MFVSIAAALVLTAGPTQLVIDVQPEGVAISVNGKKAGASGPKPLVMKLKPGKHLVRLVHKGDAHEEEVSVKAGEKKTYVWKFEGARAPGADPVDPSTPEP